MNLENSEKNKVKRPLPKKRGFLFHFVFMIMNELNLTSDEINLMIRKFMSATELKINIVDTNYSEYKYFNHLRYGTIREITYKVKILNKENKLVYFVDVYWGVVNGQLKVVDMENSSTENPFVYLGLNNKVVNQYFAEKTRGMAEEWIKLFPERK